MVCLKTVVQLHDAVFSNDDIVFVNEDSGNVIFSSDKMGILSVDLSNIKHNISLHGVNFDDDNSKIIINVRLLI